MSRVILRCLRQTMLRSPVFLVAPIALVAACRGAAMEYDEPTYAGLVVESETAYPTSALSTEPSRIPSPQAPVLGPRLIRNGAARIEVQDLDASLASSQQLASAVNGFVAGTELNEGREGARTAALILRVPSDSFQSVLDQLAELGRVLSVSVSAEDVSREYLDVETRLSVGEETVARLRELASRGGGLEDLLAAERELGRALTELESLRGQLRYYDQRVAESDLRITLVEPGAVIAAGAFRPVVQAFRDATATFARSVASVVYVAVFLAPWLTLSTIMWFGLRHWLRAFKERRSAIVA